MTVQEAITYADAVKPNAFSTADKVMWLNKIEGTIAMDVFLMAWTITEQITYTVDDLTKEMLVRPPYDDLYPLYLEAQIDYANGEYNKYANTMERFNKRMAEFTAWFARVYHPANGYIIKKDVHGRPILP